MNSIEPPPYLIVHVQDVLLQGWKIRLVSQLRSRNHGQGSRFFSWLGYHTNRAVPASRRARALCAITG